MLLTIASQKASIKYLDDYEQFNVGLWDKNRHKIVFKKEDIDWRPLLIIESHDVFGFSPFRAVYYLRFCFPSIIKCDVMKFIINRNFLLKLNTYQTCTKRSV